jgi:hypothetical protein
LDPSFPSHFNNLGVVCFPGSMCWLEFQYGDVREGATLRSGAYWKVIRWWRVPQKRLS